MKSYPFTFICGDDDYLVSEKGRTWFREQAGQLTDELSKEVVDGRASNVAEVEETLQRFRSAVETLSLFGDRKVVWLKDVNFLADTPTGRAQGTLDLLDSLKGMLAGLDPASVGVLITAQPVDKRRSFFKWCQKTADFASLAVGKDAIQVCAGLIQAVCEEAGVEISRGATELLIAKVNGHTRLIVEEARKLATYAGEPGARIDELMVAELVPNFGDADFFEAADAFYSLNLSRALEALRRHFFTNSESRPLLGSLQKRNRLLIQLRTLLDAGALRLGGRGLSKSELEAAARAYGHHFGEGEAKSAVSVFSQHPFYLGKLAETASKVPLKKLIGFQIAFTEAFEAIIERPNDQEEVCRELAIQCLG